VFEDTVIAILAFFSNQTIAEEQIRSHVLGIALEQTKVAAKVFKHIVILF
jgi:hypothetical protein